MKVNGAWISREAHKANLEETERVLTEQRQKQREQELRRSQATLKRAAEEEELRLEQKEREGPAREVLKGSGLESLHRREGTNSSVSFSLLSLLYLTCGSARIVVLTVEKQQVFDGADPIMPPSVILQARLPRHLAPDNGSRVLNVQVLTLSVALVNRTEDLQVLGE